MVSGVELIATLCNTTLGRAVNTTALNPILVPVETNRWLELERSANQWTISALAREINGKHLKVATYVNSPMSSVKTDRHRKDSLLGVGVAFLVMNILQKKFNFTYEIVLPRKNSVLGGSDPEDSLIGLVSSGKVDMAAAFVPNILQFRELVSFSTHLDEEIWVMLMQRPAESAVGEGLLAPFTERVWYYILISVVIFGPIITFLTRIRANQMPDEEPPISLYRSVWFVYGAFLKQGSILFPKATSTRVLFITWWLFIMLVAAYYTANLTAFLTLSEFTLAIDKPIDLYLNNRPWVSTQGGAVEMIVTSPQTDEMHYLNKMFKRKRALFIDSINITEYFKMVDKGYVLVKSYNSVVHGIYADYLRKTRLGVSEQDRCTYVIAPRPFSRYLRGFIYPKNSKLKILFDRVLRIINEGGLVTFPKNRNLPSTRICPMDLQSKERQLQNTDLLLTYMITACGMCTAVAVFIGELIVKTLISAKCTQKTNGKREEYTKFNENTTVHYYQDDDSQPPPYDAIFRKTAKVKLTKNAHMKIVNGREYLVADTQGGVRLVPIRTPSALLYSGQVDTYDV